MEETPNPAAAADAAHGVPPPPRVAVPAYDLGTAAYDRRPPAPPRRESSSIARLLGYVLTFVFGFGACALILRATGASFYDAGAGARGRETLSRALAQLPRAAPLPASASAVADAAAKVEPAVVNIDIQGRRTAAARGLPQLFGGRGGGGFGVEGSGSGIILSGDGYVVTNNHVVEPVAEGGGKITVTLNNNRSFSNVRIVGRDPRSDLAVLKIANVKGLPAARLGDSDRLRVGDWAIAVGNPLGFNSTVTLGIVSALNRRNLRNDNEALDKVIQTDAAVNPGNSGGALADISGQVIGINTAIISRTGTSIGIGFAIPVNQARKIIDQLVQNGSVVRPYLGVRYAKIDAEVRANLPPDVVLPDDNNGAVVTPLDAPRGREPGVTPGSPADKAGLREYDVIRKIGGRVVDGVEVVKDEIAKHDVGDKVPLVVYRSGRERKLTVTLEKMPGNFGRAAAPAEGPDLPFDLP